MHRVRTLKIVYTALLTALVCVSTAVITVPTPTNGYVHLGDSILLLAAFLLGPIYGTVAAGVGSALADLLLGYLLYAPGTLVIKAVMALVAALTARAMKRKLLGQIIGGVAAEAIMVGGYFLYAALIFGESWGAAVGIPANLVQGAFGIVAGVLLHIALLRIPYIKRVEALFL